MNVPDQIDCVDCGQPAHLLSHPPEEGWFPGDYVAYRCSGCNDRWDLVVEDGDEASAAGHSHVSEVRAILEARRQHT